MSKAMSGRLLVIEGPEFVGRTTHVRLLSERLQAHGVAVATLGLARSPLMGDLLKREGSTIPEFGGHTRALLYVTDLYDQIEHIARPALSAGYVVVADRYYYSLMIRESIRKVSMDWLRGLYTELPQPDKMVILDAQPRRQLDRLLRDSGVQQLRSYEAGTDLHITRSPTQSFLKYQSKLRKQFKALAETTGAPIIDTMRPVTRVHENVWAIFSEGLSDLLQPLE